MIKCSIVIPCFNEADNLPELMAQLYKSLDRGDFEIIIVNNGSTDSTGEFLKKISLTNAQFKIVTIPENLGYGYGILEGLKVSSGDLLAWTHSDLQTSLKDILVGINTFNNKSDEYAVIKGNRINRGFVEGLQTRLMQICIIFLLGTNIEDINGQPKLFSRVFYEKYILNRAPYDFSLDLFLLMVAKINKLPIHSFPVMFHRRKQGIAKGGGGSILNRIKIFITTINFAISIKRSLKNANN